jgi:hypothetical protein
MYMYCEPCHQQHSRVDAAMIAQAFIDGEAQIVTKYGIKNLCLLDIMGDPTRRGLRPSERSRNEAAAA